MIRTNLLSVSCTHLLQEATRSLDGRNNEKRTLQLKRTARNSLQIHQWSSNRNRMVTIMMMENPIQTRLGRVFHRSQQKNIFPNERYVILSDLHMGDGSGGDDFLPTSKLLKTALERYYHDKGFKLILNGDVEELYKFDLKKIMKRWSEIFNIFENFEASNGVFKIVGNHDLDIYVNEMRHVVERHHNALRLNYKDHSMFILHGHQALPTYECFHNINKFFFKNFVRPLPIKNLQLHFKGYITPIERQLLKFTKKNNILTFMGHTHRPLFGDLSGVPGLFNCGCAIGTRGATTLEIENGKLSLVQWLDKNNSRPYQRKSIQMKKVGDDCYRVVSKADRLSNIFNRVRPACT